MLRASLACATAYALLLGSGFGYPAVPAAVAVVLALRPAAIRWHLRLPSRPRHTHRKILLEKRPQIAGPHHEDALCST